MAVYSENYKKIIQAKKEGRYLIGSNIKGSKPPFFAIPGILVYDELARHMGEDQPFYCFEPSPYKNIKGIASFYIEQLQKIQTKGPYFLGGSCRGGIIALEMAQQLLQLGEKVPLLVLFETYSPRLKRVRSRKGFINMYRFYFNYYKIKSHYYFNVLKKMSFGKRIPYICNESFNFLARRIFKKYYNRNQSTEEVKEKQNVYLLKRYSGNVLMFNASNPLSDFEKDPMMGWNGFLTGKIESFEIEGDHTSIYREPAVMEVAEKLKSCLEKEFKKDSFRGIY